jgi:flavin reductase (DIM6/NTAB) family NADH-FMN oxidoreductase RutF
VVKDFASGVTVVTATDEAGLPSGATVSAFASLSLDPLFVLVCLRNEARSTAAIRKSGAFVVHILDEEQEPLARRFAADMPDKFAGVAYSANARGTPLITDCPLRLECRLEAELPGGDHAIFVGEVEEASPVEGFRPLLHGNRQFATLGDRWTAAAARAEG